MGYEIHIEREGSKVTLAEWREVVSNTDGVRLVAANTTTVNPKTGEVISLPNTEGHAEVYEENGQRHALFCWRKSGDIVFRATPIFNDPNSLLRTTARILARRLDAYLRGDDGELYE